MSETEEKSTGTIHKCLCMCSDDVILYCMRPSFFSVATLKPSFIYYYQTLFAGNKFQKIMKTLENDHFFQIMDADINEKKYDIRK